MYRHLHLRHHHFDGLVGPHRAYRHEMISSLQNADDIIAVQRQVSREGLGNGDPADVACVVTTACHRRLVSKRDKLRQYVVEGERRWRPQYSPPGPMTEEVDRAVKQVWRWW